MNNIFHFAKSLFKLHQNHVTCSWCYYNVLWILLEFSFTQLNCWVFKVWVGAVKPENDGLLFHCRVNCDNGWHLWSVSDRERRQRQRLRTKVPKAKSKITTQVQIHFKKISPAFWLCQHLKCKQTNSPSTSHNKKLCWDVEKSHLSLVMHRVGHLSRSMKGAGSIPKVCSLHILTMWTALL